MHGHEDLVWLMFGINYVSGKLPIYPSPKLTLTLTSHLRQKTQNDGLEEGIDTNGLMFPGFPRSLKTWKSWPNFF